MTLTSRRLASIALLSLAATVLADASFPVATQEMEHHRQASIPSAKLSIRGLDGKSIELLPDDFAALPHKAVSVFSSHTKANEKYSGVSLSDLLVKVGVPQAKVSRERCSCLA